MPLAKVVTVDNYLSQGLEAVKKVNDTRSNDGVYAICSNDSNLVYLVLGGRMSAFNVGDLARGSTKFRPSPRRNTNFPDNLFIYTGKETIGVDGNGSLTTEDPYAQPGQVHMLSGGEVKIVVGEKLVGEDAYSFLEDRHTRVLVPNPETNLYHIIDLTAKKEKDAQLKAAADSMGIDSVCS